MLSLAASDLTVHFGCFPARTSTGNSQAAWGGQRRPEAQGKHTDPDGGMSQRTGPARLPSAKIALGGGGSGPSPCCASHPSRPGPLLWRPLGRGPLPAQLPAADALGQGNEAAGPGCRAQVGSRHPTSGERQRECRPHHTFLCCPSPAVRPWTSCSPPLSRSRVQ